MSETKFGRAGDEQEVQRLSAELESELQYRNALNANARRNLYRFADPRRNFWLEIAEAMSLKGHERLLDVGTGTGVFMRTLRGQLDHDGFMLGIDYFARQFADQLIKIAREDPLQRIAFQEGDAQRLHFPDSFFDAASELFTGYHLEDPVRAIDELQRVVVPGGTIAYSTRSEKNMGKLWYHASLGAEEVGAVVHDIFYSRFNIETADEVLRSKFEVAKFIEQDSPLKVPIDRKKPGDKRGLKAYKKAFLSLADSMVDAETGEPLIQYDPSTGQPKPSVKIRMLGEYFDDVMKPNLVFEAEQHRAQEGQAYITDWVHQAAWILRNTK